MNNRESTLNIVCTIAFLIGVRQDTIDLHYGGECGELIKSLEGNKDAVNIRSLCRLRTSLMQNFRKTDNELRYNMNNINRQEWFPQDAIRALERNGIYPILANKLATDYNVFFGKKIIELIDKCKPLFPSWVEWKYILALFVQHKIDDVNTQKREFEKYKGNINNYPFQCYIIWEPSDIGNWLQNDNKFLGHLYKMNGVKFTDSDKCQTVKAEVKDGIYDFINDSDNTVLVVDCENSDVFKLYSVLKSCNKDEINKISKIMLFDDEHTSSGWDHISDYIDIPVEHLMVDRVMDRKSLVDIKVTAGVCKEFYQNGTSSFILFSSDSDYWGLISSLPDAKFMVMVESIKFGKDTKATLEKNNVSYCCIDEFCTGNIEELKHSILLEKLNEELPKLINRNGYELARSLYNRAHFEANENEIKNFYEKYIRTLKLSFDSEGNITLVASK